MKIVSFTQMRALDRAAIEQHGIPSSALMERAGAGLASLARAFLGEGESVLVVAGRGNNGGDGLVAARLLAGAGVSVRAVVLAAADELSSDARENLVKLPGSGVAVDHVRDEKALAHLAERFSSASVIVDAVLGTGLTKNVVGLFARAIEFMNASGSCVVAADIPSGIDSDDGAVRGVAVRARATATFGLPKRGLFAGSGPEHAGRVVVVDIGIPREEIARVESDLDLIEPADFAQALRPRAPSSHKGTYGHVAVFAGSGGHLGAGYLTSLAALRAGAGLATYCLPAAAFDKFDARYPEIMCDAIPDDGCACFTEAGLSSALGIARDKAALAIGPAIGREQATALFVNALLAEATAPAVVDADGLNVLDVARLAQRTAPTVLTPHPGEMAQLVGLTVREVQADRAAAARALAARTGAVVVLKGQSTAIAEPGGRVSLSPTGNPGMASAGMGDALTGVIASFIAQGNDALTAAKAAVYLHGLAGDIAARELGEAAVVASDVIVRLGRAIEEAGKIV